MEYKEDRHFVHLNAKAIRDVFTKSVVDEGKQVKRLYDKLQANFTKKNRTFIYRKTGSGVSPVDGSPGVIYSAVGSNKMHGSVLIWLEDGTDVRYARLSSDWISKTKPGGGITVGSGRGRVIGRGRFSPIKPRYFRDDIISRRFPVFAINAMSDFNNLFSAARWIQ